MPIYNWDKKQKRRRENSPFPSVKLFARFKRKAEKQAPVIVN